MQAFAQLAPRDLTAGMVTADPPPFLCLALLYAKFPE